MIERKNDFKVIFLSLLVFLGIFSASIFAEESSEAFSLKVASDLKKKHNPMDTFNLWMKLKSGKATSTYSFEDAIKLIKATPEYDILHKSASASPYTLAQLRKSMDEHIEVKEESDKKAWEQAVEPISMYGRQLALKDALNLTCDLSYLQRFKEDNTWFVTGQWREYGKYGLDELFDPVYLHRFCYEDLFPKLKEIYDKQETQEALELAVKKYVSRAPLSGSATCKGCEPMRMLSDRLWVPKGQKYFEDRIKEFKTLALKKASPIQQPSVTPEPARTNKATETKVSNNSTDLSGCQTGSGNNSLLNALEKRCSYDLSTRDQQFLFGFVQYFIDGCKNVSIYPENRTKIYNFKMNQTYTGGITNYSGSLDDAAMDPLKSGGVMNAGVKAGEAIGCNARGEKMLNNVPYILEQATKSKAGEPNFVKECVSYYNGKFDYDERKCKCVADIMMTVMPGIHQTSFSPELFKESIKRSPFLSMRIMGTCKAFNF
ncbi:hypothetical protein [Thalassotalea profundi]|uniref:Uncharacterized protein n=1 Tax=Thalassotalea profundi TaxID=2036687 RepID=A0ABQ3IHC6_9GAMM|nr:hypothetical protein [Thalassotalea profundi]GHE83659.1 hypothetical protein GCM10011501_10320 [Thalassotalea profundi]